MADERGSRIEVRGTRKSSDLDPRSSDLRGIGVLVTRPAGQAEELARMIEAAGGQAVLWPALQILPPSDPKALEGLGDRLKEAQIAIFISPNAVERAASYLATLPKGLSVAVVGEGTARALKEHLMREPELRPASRYDSEGLLALPALQQVAGKRVVIVRGKGGRELLAETLRARGAAVEYAEVYRRACPGEAPPSAIEALVQGRVQVITATSTEALRNLLRMAASLADRLRELPVVVVSERMRREAEELGFLKPALMAKSAGSEELVEALRAWASRRVS